ncbi:hypothetical protein JYT97_02940 [Haliea sp. AH-315-K21]|uniref:DUF2232 domain-containing protein n=1 Tax=SAR86 cluster bacterium TaxID=2030880 RepID=A0A2A5CJ30_9GAMM|nr:hypothetical protein [Haliea sp. AH-315-K21]MBN4075617.1 hypothetical protein [Gammaproteobacteria bacterium AH-315-E17]PCJ43376.1 MAG: hypothetical protein COA71_00450 [SAR86 cluster bacterium]
MKGLAEYAMRGRRQAIIAVLLTGLFPMIYCFSAAIVGLVNLRKSASEGLIILLWSLLPAALFWMAGDSIPMVLMLSTAILAQALKHFKSWSKMIMLGTVLGILTQLSLVWQGAYVAQLVSLVEEVILVQQSQGIVVEYSANEVVNLLLSFYGAYHFATVIFCLALARWWQAVLYNPGGFKTEFHQFKLEPGFAILLASFIVAALAGVPPLSNWLAIMCIPPLLGGLALLHYMVAFKKMGFSWVGMAYLLALFVSPVVILLGLLDSILNFRKRIAGA